MKKSILAKMTKEIRESEEIPLDTIPDIELYMEQLLTFLNQHLKAIVAKPDVPVFTKTMVNNYTKDGLLIPPKNKKYTKQHILLLILIYNLKGILSISDIKRLFEPILRDMDTPDDDLLPLEDIYTTYLELTEKHLAEFNENFVRKLSFITDKTAHLEGENNVNDAQLFLSVLLLVSQASLSKKMAELIIETYFAKKDKIPDTALPSDHELNGVFKSPEK